MAKPLKAEDVVVRRARESDAPAMAAYMAALTAEHLQTITPREAPSVEDERDWVLQAHFAERGLILMAAVDDEVIGLLDFWGGERSDNRHSGYFGMSVAKAWRGRGVGRRMLQWVIDEAHGWPGFCRIELECVAWNTAAIGLYESLGFKIEGRMVKAINLRGKPEDMLVMALTW